MNPNTVTIDHVRAFSALLLLDVPPGSEIGIDMHIWTVGKSFLGIKLVPPGVHMITASAAEKHAGQTNQISIRSGFIVSLAPAQVHVRKWDAVEETFGELLDDDTVRSYTEAFRRMEFDRGMAPYQAEIPTQYENARKEWKHLVSFVDQDVLLRFGNGKVWFFHGVESGDESLPFSTVPSLKEAPSSHKGGASTGEELTQKCMDRSHQLDDIVRRSWRGDFTCFLGELQVAFCCFIAGADLAAFGQWQKMLLLLCSCEEGINAHPGFFTEAIKVLSKQLVCLPQDLFQDVISNDNFLRRAFTWLYHNLQEAVCPPPLDRAYRQLCKVMENHFSINLDEVAQINEDDLPAVVELSPEQLRWLQDSEQ